MEVIWFISGQIVDHSGLKLCVKGSRHAYEFRKLSSLSINQFLYDENIFGRHVITCNHFLDSFGKEENNKNTKEKHVYQTAEYKNLKLKGLMGSLCPLYALWRMS